MRILLAALLLVVGYLAFSIGYTRGLRASPDYAAALRERTKFENSEELERLRNLAFSPPELDECVPIVKGAKVDEYEFCENLLSKRAMQDQEAQQDAERDRDRW